MWFTASAAEMFFSGWKNWMMINAAASRSRIRFKIFIKYFRPKVIIRKKGEKRKNLELTESRHLYHHNFLYSPVITTGHNQQESTFGVKSFCLEIDSVLPVCVFIECPGVYFFS